MVSQITRKKMLIRGQWVDGKEMIDVHDPSDNSIVDAVPCATAADMEQAIETAKEGADISEGMPVHQRMSVLTKTADYIQEKKEKFAMTIAREGSKTIREARKEVDRSVTTIRISAEEARRNNGETISFDQVEGSEDRVGYYDRYPIGVIGAITPFNDPLNLVVHKVGPAIASGNAIVVKPATVTPLSALLLADAFEKAGLPEKVLSVITGRGSELGDVLVTHPDVQMITFTGGLETGEVIAHKAGLKKVGMELGSNSPVIVLNDAEFDQAVDGVVSGAFSAAGQNCIGVQRVYVEKDQFETFYSSLVERTKDYKVGSKLSEQTDMGPMINEKEAKRVENWVQEAISKGARLLTGGQRNGAFYSPTVLTGVPENCKLAYQEVFGPVVVIYPVEDLGEAIERANDVNYGLQTGIFTKDLDKAFRTVGKMKVGGIMINDTSDYRIDSMPFGGVKGSGLGREGVKFAMQEMTEPKVVSFKLGYKN